MKKNVTIKLESLPSLIFTHSRDWVNLAVW